MELICLLKAWARFVTCGQLGHLNSLSPLSVIVSIEVQSIGSTLCGNGSTEVANPLVNDDAEFIEFAAEHD